MISIRALKIIVRNYCKRAARKMLGQFESSLRGNTSGKLQKKKKKNFVEISISYIILCGSLNGPAIKAPIKSLDFKS